MLSVPVDLISFMMETIETFIFFKCTTHMRFKHPINSTLIYFALNFISWLITLKFPSVLSWLILVVIGIFIYKCVFQKNIIEIILMYGILYILSTIVQDLLLIVLTTLHMTNENHIALVGSTLSLIIIALVSLLAPVDKLYTSISSGSTFTKFLLLHLFAAYFIEVGMKKYSTVDTTIYYPFLLAFTLIIILTDYMILKQQRTIEHQKESLASYYTYEPMLQELIQDVRGKQHDFDNHMNAIRMLPLTNTDYEALKSALTNYSDNMIADYRESALLRINMHVLSGLIFSKIKDAERRGRQLIVSVANSELSTSMPEYELIRVVGIMIDNALEAIPDGGTASLNVDSKGGQVMISTLNVGPVITPELRRKMFTVGYTTKTDKTKKHGYGLPNLKAKVEQYNGTIYLENTYIEGETYIRFEIVV